MTPPIDHPFNPPIDGSVSPVALEEGAGGI